MIVEAAEWMVDVLEEHLEELESLWTRRLAHLLSDDVIVAGLARIDRRIAAHTDGLVLAGDHALPILAEALESGERALTLAAAFAMASSCRTEMVGPVLEALPAAADEAREGLRLALTLGPMEATKDALLELAGAGPSPVAAVALSALAFHGQPLPPQRLAELARSPDPNSRRLLCRAVSYAGVDNRSEWLLDQLVADEDATVRREALSAAAWTKRPWLLDHCRTLAKQPTVESWEALELLAVLGEPKDAALILAAASTEALGRRRITLLGSFGHPLVVDMLIDTMRCGAVGTAAEAGRAFLKITGVDVSTDRSMPAVETKSAQLSEEEIDFIETVKLPDADRADNYWKEHQGELASATRLLHGREAAAVSVSLGDLTVVLRTRWEMTLRARYRGQARGTPQDLERLPQGA